MNTYYNREDVGRFLERDITPATTMGDNDNIKLLWFLSKGCKGGLGKKWKKQV